MNEQEVKRFFNEVFHNLWPKWQVNEYQFNVLARTLTYLDYDAASRAAKEHYVTRDASFGSPKIHAIVELAQKYQPKKQVDKEDRTDYAPSVFVQCIEHTNLARLYQYFPIYVCIYKQNDTDYILKAAECARKRAQALYDGFWITVQQTSFERLHLQRIEYRCGAEFKEYKKKLAEESVPKRYKFKPEPQPASS